MQALLFLVCGLACLCAGPVAAQVVKVNFQPPTSPTPVGYLADTGEIFGDRGNGYYYGWNAPTYETIERNLYSDPLRNTFNQLQRPSNLNATWEIALENAAYDVHLVCGDPATNTQFNAINIEGTIIPDTTATNFDEYNVTVTVSDGRLTIKTASGAINAKVCFVDINRQGYTNAPPWVQAGPDQAITWPGERSVPLAGAVVDDDPDGLGILTVRWSKASGPGNVAFMPADNLKETSARFDAPGSYDLRLQAWDELMQAGSDLLKVTIDEAALVGDVDGDRDVDLTDMALLAERWIGGGNNTADLDGSGQVDLGDYSLLAKNLGQKLSTVRINEFMTTNSYTPLVSGLNIFTRIDAANPVNPDQHPDWIELFNNADEAVDLAGWSLTDDKDLPAKWRFPAGATIPAGGYLIVFASDKEQADYPTNYPFVDYYGALHTNFELGAGGEYLALIDPEGRVAYAFDNYPRQYGLVSYGIGADGKEGYLKAPTPGTRVNNLWTGAANGDRYLGAVGDTHFSHGRGFYEQAFDVMLSCDTPGAIIRYTTDGSRPTTSHGTVYTRAVRISGTTLLRATAFRTGWLESNVDTQTYIFLNDVIQQATNTDTGAQVTPSGCPDQWAPTGADGTYGTLYAAGLTGDYQVDPDVIGQNGTDLFGGLYAGTIRDDLKSIPTLSLVMPRDDWFGAQGIYIHEAQDDTERWCSAEFIDPAGGDEFQVDCAVRMQGGVSHDPTSGGTSLERWKSYKCSMRLVFRGGYGAGNLEFPLYSEQGTDRFNTVILEAQLNNVWHHSALDQQTRGQNTHDQYPSDVQNALKAHGTHGRPVHLYLSGLYWGLYWIHERPDEHFAESYLGGDSYDYDVLKHNAGGVINGSNANYNEMFSAGGSTVAQIERYLDVTSFIDYIIMNFYVGNTDWGPKNWYATRNRRDPAGRWRYHSWDAEHCLEILTTNVTGLNNSYAPTGLHQKLTAGDPEYRLKFADRVHKHFFNNGQLTPAGGQALYQNLLNQIDRAVVGESARWGDNRRAMPYTRDVEWAAQRNSLLGTYFPGRTQTVLNQLKSRVLYPNTVAPSFNQHGGHVPTGFALTMSAPAGTIYYTLDGSDPRQTGGAAVGTAYTGPIVLSVSAAVKARAWASNQWSALNEAAFAVGPVRENLRITEMMYHPTDPPLGSGHTDEEYEYIELANVGAEAINLSNVRFANGVDLVFGQVPLIPAERVLVVKNETAFRSRYPAFGGVIAGAYTGSLDNNGERIELLDAIGTVIHDFQFSDGWFDVTDGGGFSLTIRDAANADLMAWGQREGWRPSAAAGGSPGADDSGQVPPLGAVVINEVMAHSHATEPDWIELYNTTAAPIPVGGWFLSDSSDDFLKYEIPAGTVIPENGYVVFYENLHFGNAQAPGCRTPFAMSENGDAVYLHSGENGVLTGYNDEESFGASETGVSLGRYQKSGGTFNFVAMSEPTPGEANAYPKVEPVVISEIMYSPPGNADAEYVELLNVATTSVTLYDLLTNEPWRFTDEGGIEALMPVAPVVTLAPGGRILLVKDLLAYQSVFGPAPVRTVDWGDGSLSNGGEQIQLSMPGDVDELMVRQYIRVDRVVYSDGSHPVGADPWPTEADGLGKALVRKVAADYGNDVVNWQAATPTPGY